MKFYRDGLDALAGDFVSAATASGTGGVPSVPNDQDFGPMSPAQLATLSRPLSDAEKKAVADWYASEAKKKASAEAALKAAGTPRASGAPAYSLPSSIAPTKTGAPPVKASGAGKPDEGNFLTKDAFWGLKVWQASLLGLGVAAIGAGVVVAVVKR